MKKPRQIVMHCPCGNPKILASNLCTTCYTLKRQDEAHFTRVEIKIASIPTVFVSIGGTGLSGEDAN